jgi:hypothetical protein
MGRVYARQSSANLTVCAPSNQFTAANPLLTGLCGLQVPECGSLSFNIPVTPVTTPPYSLIVYTGAYTTSVYPLTVDRLVTAWTVDYPACQSHSFLPTFAHRVLANVVA